MIIGEKQITHDLLWPNPHRLALLWRILAQAVMFQDSQCLETELPGNIQKSSILGLTR